MKLRYALFVVLAGWSALGAATPIETNVKPPATAADGSIAPTSSMVNSTADQAPASVDTVPSVSTSTSSTTSVTSSAPSNSTTNNAKPPAAATGFSANSTSPAAAIANPAISSNPSGLVAGLLFLLALVAGAAWLVKRSGGAQPWRSSASMKVVAALSVGQRERVVLIEVGGQQWLLGVAAGSVTTLHHFEQPIAASTSSAEDFSSRLRQFLPQGFGK